MLSVCAALCFAACDSKLCYCYEATASGVSVQEVYTNSDTHCGALSNSNRQCVEKDEYLPPEDIAWK